MPKKPIIPSIEKMPKPVPPVLTFEHGKYFVLTLNPSLPKMRRRLENDAYWEKIDPYRFKTRDLGAARTVRKYADEKVTKIFKKTFQEHYTFPLSAELPPELDDHQVEGLYWILTRKRSYLAHAPGAGKTAQAVLAAYYSKGPALFIVPPSLTRNWEREIFKVTSWVDEFPSVGIIGRTTEKDFVSWKADYLICPDSMLARPWVAERLRKKHFSLIAVDEASRFKEPFTKRSLAFYGGVDGTTVFSPLFRNAKHVVFLDGSPMPNRPIELWAPTYALHPESIDCMDYDAFGYRYGGARINEFGVWEYHFSSNEEELKKKLRTDFMHVVGEKELEHPERKRALVFLSHDVRSNEHKDWERRHLNEVELSDEATTGDLARFRRELGLRKVVYVAEYVTECLEKGESVLVFAWHREVIGRLVAALSEFNPLHVLGGQSESVRKYACEGFQGKKSRLLIMNIAVGGRGLNLQTADRVVFAEFSWTDEINRQAEKRASRKGSTKSMVRCDYLVAPNSMDEVVLKSVFAKERRVKKVIG